MEMMFSADTENQRNFSEPYQQETKCKNGII